MVKQVIELMFFFHHLDKRIYTYHLQMRGKFQFSNCKFVATAVCSSCELLIFRVFAKDKNQRIKVKDATKISLVDCIQCNVLTMFSYVSE